MDRYQHFALAARFAAVLTASCTGVVGTVGGSTTMGHPTSATGGTTTGGTSTDGTSTGGTTDSTGAGGAGPSGPTSTSTSGTGGMGMMGGAGGSGPFIPPKCADPGTPPTGQPMLTPGVWKDISPSGGGLKFGGGANLTQGMALDPCNPSTVYACICAVGGSASYPKGLYRSLDGGSTWTNIHAFDSCVRVRVNPANPQHLYVGDGVAGGTHGFWVSNDGGKTFAKPDSWATLLKTTYVDDVYDVAPDPTDFNHVLVSSHSPWAWTDPPKPAGVIESKDGGKTWILHPPSGDWGYGHSIQFLYAPTLGIGNSNTWILGIQNNGGRYRTTDGGATWAKVTDVSIQHGGTTLYYTKSGVVYSGGSPSIVKSPDNGATWTAIGPGNGYLTVMGDGRSLYSGPILGPTPMITATESNDSKWANYNGGTQVFTQGPFEMAFDSTNGILYSASQEAGVWALKVMP